MIALAALVVTAVLYFALRPKQPTSSYVIGQQIADAEKHEKTRLKRGNLPRSPLPNGRYERKTGEWGLLNPAPSDLDTKIRESCKAFRPLSQPERVKFTSAISLDEFY